MINFPWPEAGGTGADWLAATELFCDPATIRTTKATATGQLKRFIAASLQIRTIPAHFSRPRSGSQISATTGSDLEFCVSAGKDRQRIVLTALRLERTIPARTGSYDPIACGCGRVFRHPVWDLDTSHHGQAS